MLKAKYNRLGGLVVDRDIRGIIAFLTSFTSWSVREKFERLIHISMLLNLDTVSEISDLETVPGAARLSTAEIKKVLKRRIDLSSEDIDAIKI